MIPATALTKTQKTANSFIIAIDCINLVSTKADVPTVISAYGGFTAVCSVVLAKTLFTTHLK